MLCCGMPGSAHSASELRTIHGSLGRNKSGPNKMTTSKNDDVGRKTLANDGGNMNYKETRLGPNGLATISISQSLSKLRDAVVTPSGSEYNPLSENFSELCHQVSMSLQSTCVRCPETLEMLRLLNNSSFRSFIECYDQIAVKNFLPVLPDIPYEVDEDDDTTVKIIRLVKNPSEPLGATLQVHEETGCILIARVMLGGAADRCGLIQPGDEVREVNGTKVLGKDPDDVIRLMSSSSSVTLTLMPGDCDSNCVAECKMRVRAQFDFDPSEDRSIPCHEAGISFNCGDILEIVSQDDDTWWQARRLDGDKPGHAGLIPSTLLLRKRRESSAIAPNCVTDSKEDNANAHDPEDTCASLSYEEVQRFIPNCQRPRPIALVGPPGVGRSELRRRLVAGDPNRFREPVPCTSRLMRPGEVDGEEYYFVSRSTMESDILNKRYLEFGEYNGNLYGTTVDEVISIVNSAHVCVLCPKVQALRSIRCPQLKPFVVFIRPVTSLDRLSASRASSSRKFTIDELKDMIKSAEEIENQFRQYFDLVLVNDELEKTLTDLRHAIFRVESQPQWLPASWIDR